jgi:hypothetical protein
MSVTDCLVLQIEEYDDDKQCVYTCLYIFYDKKEENYVIRGKQKHKCSSQFIPYSFVCLSEKGLADFIEYAICPYNKVNEILYNFPDLPRNSNEITFDFLDNYKNYDNYENKIYEVSGYNNKPIIRKILLKNLRILKNVFNYYN